MAFHNHNNRKKDEVARICSEIKAMKVTKDNAQEMEEKFKSLLIQLLELSPESEKIEGVDAANAGICLIDMLDHDCLEQIFIRLPPEEILKARQVCTNWRETSEFVWANVKKLKYTPDPPKCEDPKNGVPCLYFDSLRDLKLKFYYIPNLFTLCGRYVQKLDISKFGNSIILTAVKGNFPNLVKLCMIMSEWKDEHMNSLFTGMTKLKYLYVMWNHKKMVPLTFFEALNDVVDTLKDVRIINMRFHSKKPEKLNIYQLEDSCLPTIRHLQSLHSLLLESFKINKNTVEAISQLKNLKKLFLVGCEHENVSTMDPLLNLINLEILDPGLCYENCDSFLMEIPNKLKNLKDFQIEVRNATDAGILSLTNLKSLKKIVLENMDSQPQISDYSIEKFRNMKKIYFKNLPEITDDSITRILNNSPDLRLIQLKKTGVTFATVEHIINTMKNRRNGTGLLAIIDLPDDKLKLQDNLPKNLQLELEKGSE